MQNSDIKEIDATVHENVNQHKGTWIKTNLLPRTMTCQLGLSAQHTHRKQVINKGVKKHQQRVSKPPSAWPHPPVEVCKQTCLCPYSDLVVHGKLYLGLKKRKLLVGITRAASIYICSGLKAGLEENAHTWIQAEESIIPSLCMEALVPKTDLLHFWVEWNKNLRNAMATCAKEIGTSFQFF